ncbi:MAG: ABC transporter ATP-binding protein [Candidatus Loosdrechtia sp.]|uniref:ABC transporter ATP-binding protein n=1 Tax=Candidatus Loosdrechtia sp. TaxID=3101272 RepID=UPI003A6A71E7|nr:MAG: ABC transporter ATP-binding protein [Candidatus Jettenia sp. AMX2]
MSYTVIKVENLGKRYFLRHQKKERYTALRDVITNKIKSLSKRIFKPESREPIACNTSVEEFWALRDVSFEIKQGDRVGIIGRNGAGKTTVLKILSRITEPTTGRVSIKGRVASLLEVGTGFHPELTGRENIYLNGAILGMTKAEIKKKFDEIVAFAEVEKFLDTPVKRYSSGMYVRLAFAVAAHLETEILLIDEVLAVGDAQFQDKCIGRMDEVSRNGKTILFVSHNFSAVQRLCNTGIFLESGRIKIYDKISIVLETYQQAITAGKNDIHEISVKDGEARFVKWQLIDASTQLQYSCYSRDNCRFLFTLLSKRKVSGAFIGFAVWNLKGDLILAVSSLDGGGKYLEIEEGMYQLVFKVKLPLKAGSYQLDISLNSLDQGQVDRWSAEPKLAVLPRLNTNLPEYWHGLLNEEVKFEFYNTPTAK